MAEGRGRLSSIDLMPEEGQEDIAWAMGELNARERTQAEILSELNGRLADKGLPLISKSAFNRRSMRVAALNRRAGEKAAIVAAIAPALTPDKIEEMDRVVGEILKMTILEVLDRDGERVGTKGAMELARGYQAVIQGQAKSADAREKREKQFAEKITKGLEAVGKETGLSSETVAKLRREFLGMAG